MPLTPGPPMEPLSANRLPSTDALSGETLVLELIDGGRLVIEFRGETAAWVAEDLSWQGAGEDPCDVVEAADGVFFIDIDFQDFIRGLEAVTVIVAKRTGWALMVFQERFHPEETWSRGPEVRHEFSVARLDGRVQVGPAPGPTRDLIGHHHLYRYSPANLYEHLYLSSEKVCAHNVSTVGTPGRADCHPAAYYRITEHVYLVAWREYDSAAGMLSVLDLERMQCTGKVLHPEHFLRSVTRPFGGPITLVGATAYPDGLEPR